MIEEDLTNLSGKEHDLGEFDKIIFPHVRYITLPSNKKGKKYKKYVGNNELLTNGKVYEFWYCSYSPNRETPYKEYLVTKSDTDTPYVRYVDTKKDWRPATRKSIAKWMLENVRIR